MKTKLKTIAEMKLLPYQSAFAANRSRVKIGLSARQTGKDHTAQTAPGGVSTIGRKYPMFGGHTRSNQRTLAIFY
jgi:hypothetical protein